MGKCIFGGGCLCVALAVLSGCVTSQQQSAVVPAIQAHSANLRSDGVTPELRVGNWHGVLTQPGFGNYSFKIHVTSSSQHQIAGTSHIQLGSEWAIMSFTGTTLRGTVNYSEQAILQQHGGNWCIKSATLHFSRGRDVLKGPWSASGCTGGEIKVKR
jgi:hypothetical protein